MYLGYDILYHFQKKIMSPVNSVAPPPGKMVSVCFSLWGGGLWGGGSFSTHFFFQKHLLNILQARKSPPPSCTPPPQSKNKENRPDGKNSFRGLNKKNRDTPFWCSFKLISDVLGLKTKNSKISKKKYIEIRLKSSTELM